MTHPTPPQVHNFLETYLSKQIDIDNIKTFLKTYSDGTPKEQELLEICVSIFSPFNIDSILSLSNTSIGNIPKEVILEKEIQKLNNEIVNLKETIEELRGNYISLYRRSNKIQ